MTSDLWFSFFEGCWHEKAMATLELTSAPGGENRLLSLRVTPEQEIAIYAFFQINGWTIITEGRNCFNFQDIITVIIINIFSLHLYRK